MPQKKPVAPTIPGDAGRSQVLAQKASILRSEATKASGPMKADLARKASQFEMKTHGANGNLVSSKSSAIAPHDKDK